MVLPATSKKLSMDRLLSDNVILRERAARSLGWVGEKNSEASQSTFVHCLTRVALLGARHDDLVETELIFEFLTFILAEPEQLLTAAASIYVTHGQYRRAEALLEKILTDKPDFAIAQVYLAGAWAIQNKQGWLPILQKILATSLDPLVRNAAQKILDSRVDELKR
jgi:hypothetical protein